MKAKAGSHAGDSRLAVKKSKAEKDPNKPKRPPSAFFVFMDTFRKEYKEKHLRSAPSSLRASVGKAGGEKWKSLSDVEKKEHAQEKKEQAQEKNN
ncbi:HMG1/2-like protein [Triticum aestivum]|uniref:HMG1/2-like protein n=1 Tax=Triticum aestivum TaxID=4565 RepID=UPI001D01F0BF|nr:HMG1/2-like protein [Triticum aestivum]